MDVEDLCDNAPVCQQQESEAPIFKSKKLSKT